MADAQLLVGGSSTATTGVPKKAFDLKSKLRTFTMVFALLAIWAIFEYVTGGAFLQSRNLSNLFRQTSVTGILSVGMVLILVAGQVDLSVGSVVCFLGAILAVLNVNMGMSASMAFAITLACGALIGTVQGFLHAYQRVPSFIVTLGGMMIFRGASMWITQNTTIPLNENWIASLGTAYVSPQIGWVITGCGVLLLTVLALRDRQARIRYGLGAQSLMGMLLQVGSLAAVMLGFMSVMASYQGIPVPVLIMLGLMLLIFFVSTQTTWGRHIYAIGGNLEAARLSGINVRFRMMSIFTLMGSLCALAGVVLTARVGSASPDAGGLLELDAIASCVIGGTSLMGGKGSVPGAILGALVMESLNNGMSMANIEPFWQYCVKGFVLVVAVWIDMMSQDKK